MSDMATLRLKIREDLVSNAAHTLIVAILFAFENLLLSIGFLVMLFCVLNGFVSVQIIAEVRNLADHFIQASLSARGEFTVMMMSAVCGLCALMMVFRYERFLSRLDVQLRQPSRWRQS